MATSKVKPRTTRRVQDSGRSSGGAATKTAAHNSVSVNSSVPVGGNGLPMIEIVSQASELVPVAQYANVTIGPVMVRRWVEDPGVSQLAGTDPEDFDSKQKKVYDAIFSEISTTQAIVQEIISEDREAVEESVRLHNQRAAEEEAKASGKRGSR